MSAVIYRLLQVLCRVVGKLCFRFQVVGEVPRTGGFIIAVNHASYLDIPFVGCGIRRRAWYLGRRDLFPIPGLKSLCQWLGWIPMQMGRFDREAFGKAVSLIKQGKIVVIFPEGRRSIDGVLQLPKSGIGMMVAQTGCMVVPAYLKGTFQALPMGAKWPCFSPVTVFYGAPIRFPLDGEQGVSKEFYEEVSCTVMGHIAALGAVESPVEPCRHSQR